MSREVAFAHPQAMHLRDNLEGIKTFGALAMGRRDHLVELSADPYAADTDRLTDQVKVLGTWMDGVKIDTDAFISKIEAIDPTEHKGLHEAALSHSC